MNFIFHNIWDNPFPLTNSIIVQDGHIAPPTSSWSLHGHLFGEKTAGGHRILPAPRSQHRVWGAAPHRRVGRRSAWRRRRRRRTRRQGGSARRRGAKNSRDLWEATCWDLETLGNLGEIGREMRVFDVFLEFRGKLRESQRFLEMGGPQN